MAERSIGIIAGGGSLPGVLIRACRAHGWPVFVVVLDRTQTAPEIEAVPHQFIRIGAVGAILSALREAGAREVVLAGGIKRPSFLSLKPDARGVKLLAKLGGQLGQGDDALLRTIVAEIESEGFTSIGAQDLLRDLVAPEGCWGRVDADDAAHDDIARALHVVKTLGALDIGQAAVVQQGIVLGVEAVEGTDALLERVGALRREGPGGVLVKAAKPDQERRADLPTIGVETVRRAAEAGLRGIAVEAGNAIVVDREGMIAAADEAGLFVLGVTPRAGRADR